MQRAFWVPGNTKVCNGKQLCPVILVEKEELAVIEGTDDAENSEFHDAEAVPTLNISMHALTGISDPLWPVHLL